MALTDFYMEPYVALMDMNFIYHSVPFPELDTIEINKINKVMKKIFEYFKLDYNTQLYGVNSFKLIPYLKYLNFFTS